MNQVGLVSMLNAAANRIARPIFPAPLGLTLVAVIQLPPDYVSGTSVEVEFTVTSTDESEIFGRAIGSVEAQLLPGTEGVVGTATLILDLSGVALTKAGIYKINGTIKGGESESIYLQVAQVESFAAPQQAMPSS